MTFLYPSFLYALGFVIIPVIIHLFNFRRFKRQEFTQVKFLEKATKVKKRFRQIRDLIIMLLRMLAIACLVLAFAHPIPKDLENSNQKQSLVSIYLDNSFSMGQQGESGELLAEAKTKIEDILDAFGEDALFQLVTNNIEERNKKFGEKDLILDVLEEVDLEPLVIDYKELNQIQESDLLENNGNRVQVLVSDFQKVNFTLDHELDSSIATYWISLQAQDQSNISIDSSWFEQALFVKDQTAALVIRLTNHSSEKAEARTIILKVNGVQRAIQNIDLLPFESKEVELNYKITDEGWNQVEVKIEDFPIEFDNSIYTTYHVDAIRNVLGLYSKQPNPYVRKVFTNDVSFAFTQNAITAVSAKDFDGVDLVIVESAENIPSGTLDLLLNYVKNGGNMAFAPAKDADNLNLQKAYQEFGINLDELVKTKTELKTLELNHPFFNDIFDDVPKNVDYPSISAYYKSTLRARANTQSLITLSNGDTYLYISDYGTGRVFSIMSPLDLEYSSITKNGLFVPLLYKFAMFKGNQTSGSFFIDQKPTSVRLVGTSKTSILALHQNDYSFIPNQVLKNGVLTLFEEELVKDGFYKIKESSENDSILYIIGFNYDRSESEMKFWSMDELKDFAKMQGVSLISNATGNITAIFKDLNDKNRLWRYFLLAAFCFLLFEIIAIKLPFK